MDDPRARGLVLCVCLIQEYRISFSFITRFYLQVFSSVRRFNKAHIGIHDRKLPPAVSAIHPTRGTRPTNRPPHSLAHRIASFSTHIRFRLQHQLVPYIYHAPHLDDTRPGR